MAKYITSTGTIYRMETGSQGRSFQNLETGATYEMKVMVEREGKAAMVVGLMNGRVAYCQSWMIDVLGAMRYSALGYLPNVDAAISGAYACMESQLPK